MVFLFNSLARLPLPLLHVLGSGLGWLIYLASPRYAARLRENLAQAGWRDAVLRRAAIREAGKGVLELPWVWGREFDIVVAAVRQCTGWEVVEAARARGRGVIFLTPHIGCFEVIALYLAARFPLTSLYRTPRYAWLDELMHRGRERGQMKLAAADLSGVRLLLKALKRGEAIGILPDQVPGNGEGEWAPFFGRPAYTMTLVGKLAQASGAPLILCIGERLPHGAGYALHFSEFVPDADISLPLQLNAALEAVIRRYPAQYLWSYNRYKVPRGVEPPAVPGR
ncbi:MAG: lysophospholipid acyltransferase family protein [Sideroxydans sp.]